MLNFTNQSRKSCGETSLGKLLGSAVADILVNLFVSGGLGFGGRGGGLVGGPPPEAAAKAQSAALAFLHMFPQLSGCLPRLH